MTMKLNLDELKVRSFVTSREEGQNLLQGGHTFTTTMAAPMGISLNDTCLCHSRELCSEENCFTTG